MKYEEVLNKWLADQRTYQKYSTYTCYANIVENHLLPHLGQLEEVTTDIVQDLALRLLESGNRVTGGGLSQSFVRDILTVIKITCPHVGEIRLPYEPPKEIEIFNQPEMVALVNYLQSCQTPKSVGVLLTIHTGIRIGELCALQWSDVDLTARVLHIRKTIIRTYTKTDGSRLAITPPKSKASIRTIPLNSWICHLLSLQQKGDDCYIITGNERPQEPGKYRLWYNRQLWQLGIPQLNQFDVCISFGCGPTTAFLSDDASVSVVRGVCHKTCTLWIGQIYLIRCVPTTGTSGRKSHT